MFWFIVLLLVVGAGFYFYQKMMAIEQEIRAEQGVGDEHVSPAQEPERPAGDPIKASEFDKESNAAAAIPELTTIEEAVISAVTKSPGIKQTDLYLFFADTDKKQLQKIIKSMSDNGVLRREKQGSSYLLYCA
jgi:hypothetical protein